MKLQTLFMLLLAVSLIFIIAGSIVADFNKYYDMNATTTDIDPETGETRYDYHNQIQLDILNISGDLTKLGEETGWNRILGGLRVFAKGVITFVLGIFLAVPMVFGLMGALAVDLGLPQEVIDAILPILTVMIVGTTIVMIVKFLHKPSPGV